VLIQVINEKVSNTTLSINQATKNVAHNQAAPSSRVSSAQDDPDNSFIKLQLRWKILRNHRDTDLYWFCDDDPVSLSKNSGIITDWLLLLLVEKVGFMEVSRGGVYGSLSRWTRLRGEWFESVKGECVI
jgi:hypothetical protein